MSLPHLNHSLTLEAPERVDDGSGGYTEVWVPLGTLWAEITARTGRETDHGGAPVSLMSYRIIVRGAPYGAASRPRPEQRFRDGQRKFRILAVAETDRDGRFLTCFAEEEQVV
ncbi:MAG: head-tail adaptor protein [Pseudomonadota bacterium]